MIFYDQPKIAPSWGEEDWKFYRIEDTIFLRALRGGGGGIFFIERWKYEEEWIWPFKPFSKLKTTGKSWRFIKIKISMTCVYKEYEVKIKMANEQWLQLKMNFYWIITCNCYLVGGLNFGEGGNKSLVGGIYWKGNFSRWGEWPNFWLWRKPWRGEHDLIYKASFKRRKLHIF